jgi:hypothetical protein
VMEKQVPHRAFSPVRNDIAFLAFGLDFLVFLVPEQRCPPVKERRMEQPQSWQFSTYSGKGLGCGRQSLLESSPTSTGSFSSSRHSRLISTNRPSGVRTLSHSFKS